MPQSRLRALQVHSLNKCLLHGPIILLDFFGLLLKFCSYELVLLADVEQTFLQIRIQEMNVIWHISYGLGMSTQQQ